MTKIEKIELQNKPVQVINISFGKFYMPLADAMINASFEDGNIYFRFMGNDYDDTRPVMIKMLRDGDDCGSDRMIYLNSLNISAEDQLHIFYWLLD